MGYKPIPRPYSMVTNTVPPPRYPSGQGHQGPQFLIVSWKCELCGRVGEYDGTRSSIENEEVEHLLKTSCGGSLKKTGVRDEQSNVLPPIPPKMVTG